MPTASTTAAKPTAKISAKNLTSPSPTRAPSHGKAPVPPATSLTKVGSCQVFPPNNPWNENISKLPVNPNSAEYIASINSTKQFLHPDFGSNLSYGIPYAVVPRSQPKVPIHFTAYGDQSDKGPYPIPSGAPVTFMASRNRLTSACRWRCCVARATLRASSVESIGLVMKS